MENDLQQKKKDSRACPKPQRKNQMNSDNEVFVRLWKLWKNGDV